MGGEKALGHYNQIPYEIMEIRLAVVSSQHDNVPPATHVIPAPHVKPVCVLEEVGCFRLQFANHGSRRELCKSSCFSHESHEQRARTLSRVNAPLNRLTNIIESIHSNFFAL